MKIKLLALCISLFLLGCGSSSGSSNENNSSSLQEGQQSILTTEPEEVINNQEPQESTTTQEAATEVYTEEEILSEPNIKTQWGMYYDESFFNSKGIDSRASINGNSVYKTYSGKNIKIAVIDNGFEVNHPELQGRVHSTHNFSNVGSYTDVSHTKTTEYHGTAVAGIIAANMDKTGIRGVAPNAELILIKFGETNSDIDFIKMFKTAIDNGADIINCSWGTGSVPEAVAEYLEEITQTGRDGKGVLIVFASGNSDTTIGNDEAALDSVIGVGATDHDNLRTNYSNYGPELDIMVPGGGDNSSDYSISTIDPQYEDGATSGSYNLYNATSGFIGTSASAPILSGALALLLESNYQLTKDEVIAKLQKSSDKISENVPYLIDIDTYGSTEVTFYGDLGNSGYENFKLRITSLATNQYKEYSVNITSNSWNYTLELEEGNYKSELIYYTSSFWGRPITNYLATDGIFTVDTSKTTLVKGQRNDYYGYGKLNLEKLLEN